MPARRSSRAVFGHQDLSEGFRRHAQPLRDTATQRLQLGRNRRCGFEPVRFEVIAAAEAGDPAPRLIAPVIHLLERQRGSQLNEFLLFIPAQKFAVVDHPVGQAGRRFAPNRSGWSMTSRGQPLADRLQFLPALCARFG